MVAGKHFAADLAKQETLLTVQGGMLEVHEHHWLRHEITINDAVVKDANLECANGVIHIIDTVLMPTRPRSKRRAEKILRAVNETNSGFVKSWLFYFAIKRRINALKGDVKRHQKQGAPNRMERGEHVD
ncbi:MAG: fasciclin domain-containing protein [Halobacteriota archaeon]